jgi:hypothetical protein
MPLVNMDQMRHLLNQLSVMLLNSGQKTSGMVTNFVHNSQNIQNSKWILDSGATDHRK